MSTPPATGIVLPEQPLRPRRRSSGRCPPPCPSRRGRRRSACRRCGPRAPPAPRGAASSASASRWSSARAVGRAPRARQAGKARLRPLHRGVDLLRPGARHLRHHLLGGRLDHLGSSAPPPCSPAPPPRARRSRCARPPRGATGRRARTRGPAARSPPPGRRPRDHPVTTRPSPSSVDALVVVRLDAAARRPPRAPPASPARGAPRGRRTRPACGGGRRGRRRRGGAGRCVPPQGHVQHLHTAADAEHRHVALERPVRQRQLEAVALGPGARRSRDAARPRMWPGRRPPRRRAPARRAGRASRRATRPLRRRAAAPAARPPAACTASQ